MVTKAKVAAVRDSWFGNGSMVDRGLASTNNFEYSSTTQARFMKRNLLLISMLVLFFVPAIGQKILLKIPSITAAAGEDVRAVEFKVDNTIKWGTGGSGVGKTVVGDMLIKKSNSTSTNELYKKVLTGVVLPTVTIEYYDASNVLFFTITLKSVYVTNFYWLSPECPTCLKMEHQVAFNPRQIETTDAATGITVKYDVVTASIYN